MDQRTAVVLVAIAFSLVAGVAAWFYSRERRSRMLRERFGPEYDRVIRQEG
jgi:protein-S-isoprenylcysteine O-methyltransferase Ste14